MDPEWQLLLQRVGDAIMLHLLLHCSIFLPLPNNSFLQAAGLPIHEVRAGPRGQRRMKGGAGSGGATR